MLFLAPKLIMLFDYKYLTMLDKFHIALQCLFVQMANLSQSTFLFRGNKRDGQTINKNKLCQVQD
jgi:hypothetical protein